MKHIKYFETSAARAAATLERPYLVYTEETGLLEIEDEFPITSEKNAALMSVCYSQGWAENADYMTYEECEAVTNEQLAASVTVDGDTHTSAFTSVVNFNELKLFKGITVIPEYCFYNCSVLEHIDLQNISAISAYAFYGCSHITELELPNTLTSIGGYALSGVGLSSIVIPSSCTYIDSYALLGIPRLDLTKTSISTMPKHIYNNPIWVKIPSTCTKSGGDNKIGTYGYTKKGWLWFDGKTPYSGTYGDAVGNQYPVRVYVPDDVVDIWKNSSIKVNSSVEWRSIAGYIFPHSQWADDLVQGLIEE